MPETGHAFDLRAYVGKLSSDLGRAILTAAIVEEQLELLLLAHLDVNEKVAELLFSGRGCYGSFDRKIDLARKESLIDKRMCNDLRIIKNIRNEFAHTRNRLTFSSEAVRQLATKFSQAPKDFNARQLFDARVESLVNALRQKTDELIWQNANTP